jgi:hypothetical protein
MFGNICSIHWLAPTTLFVSFAAGVGLAVGHHCFYSSLHNQPIAQYSQQYNNAIGTAFSLLVRAALVIAISTTYWQVFWRRLHQDLPLATVDSLAGILGSLQEFLSLETLKASPLLVVLALLAWLIPVAVIFPPATLSVIPLHNLTSNPVTLKAPNFTNSEVFARTSMRWNGPGVKRRTMSMAPPPMTLGRWDGPTSRLKRVMMSTAYQAQLPPIAAPIGNSTFDLYFHGPAVQCDETQPDSVLGNLTIFRDSPYYYLSWVVENDSTSPNPPFGEDYDFSSALSINKTLGVQSSPPEVRAPNVFVALRPTLVSDDWKVINCSLRNASYGLAFNYTNSNQEVSVFQADVLNPVIAEVTAMRATQDFALSSPDQKSYFAFMDMLGSILTGTLWLTPESTVDTGLSSINAVDHTRILETDLALTAEMRPLYSQFTSFEPPRDASPPSLASSIEQLFQNMTLSILAEPGFLAPQSALTTVDIHRVYNAYSYNWRRLALAYGIAITSTFCAILVGCYTIVSTGFSYSNKFSTIVRVSRSEKLDVLIAPEDRRGHDPLPEHIAKTAFSIADGTEYTVGMLSEATKLRSRSPGRFSS